MKLEQAKNTLRLIAGATTDVEVRKLALDALGETQSDIQNELSKTCFKNDLGSLREALIKNNEFIN